MRERFEQLTLPLMDALYRFALSLCGNEGDATDLTQETYLKAFRSFESFHVGTNLRAWMTRIMKNTYIDMRRRHRHEPASLDAGEDPVDPPAAPRSTAVPEEPLARELMDAFHALDPADRAILMLSDVQGHTYKEIAEILDIPMGTVMSRLHRARAKLRALLHTR